METPVQQVSLVAIWIAMAAWTVAMASWYLSKNGKIQNTFWMIGLMAFGVHIWSAFDGFYGWSLDTALDETARLTEEVTGWRSGVGLWVNFAFFAALAADFAMRVFREGGVCAKQNRIVEILVIFMMINGAIVFADGPVRWFGIVLLVGLVAAVWYAKMRDRISS